MNKNDIPLQVKEVIKSVEEILNGQIIGIYLYGSAVLGGLNPNSDLDILIIIKDGLSEFIRKKLTLELLNVSGKIGSTDKRPLELTIIRQEDISPLKFPPRCEYMYGEWIRDEMESGNYPKAFNDPDIVILLWQARKQSIALNNVSAEKIIPYIPMNLVKKAIVQSIPNLLENYKGDERNTLLTLARMWFTLSNENICTKDEGASWAIPKLPKNLSELLLKAEKEYLGECEINWNDYEEETADLIDFIKYKIISMNKEEL